MLNHITFDAAAHDDATARHLQHLVADLDRDGLLAPLVQVHFRHTAKAMLVSTTLLGTLIELIERNGLVPDLEDAYGRARAAESALAEARQMLGGEPPPPHRVTAREVCTAIRVDDSSPSADDLPRTLDDGGFRFRPGGRSPRTPRFLDIAQRARLSAEHGGQGSTLPAR